MPSVRWHRPGFLDDDAAKHGTRYYGLRVWGGFVDMADAVRVTRAEQVVITSSKIPLEKARAMSAMSRKLGIPCSRMTFSFTEQLSESENAERELEIVEI